MLFDRSSAVYVGNLGPVPLFIHPSALVLVMLAWMWAPTGGGGDQIIIVALLLGVLVKAILLHELGHGLAAMVQGARGVTITLWAMGGLCSSQRDNDRPLGEMIILAAGPAVSFLLWGISEWAILYMIQNHPERLIDGGQATLLYRFLLLNSHVNFWLGIFNSLPIFPLDGGQFLYQGMRLLRIPWLVIHRSCFVIAVIFVAAVLAWRISISGGDLSGGFVYTAILLGFLLYNAHVYLMQR